MKVQITPAPAELADRTLQLLAVTMFAVALLFCLSVAEFFASESLAELIDIASKVLAIGVIGLMGLIFYWKLRVSPAEKHKGRSAEDGFLQVGFEKAMAKSWMFSFLFLVVLQALDNLVLARLPAMPLELVVHSVLALMLLLLSVSFLLLTRSKDDEE